METYKIIQQLAHIEPITQYISLILDVGSEPSYILQFSCN